MKKKIAMFLTVLMVFGLFAGCERASQPTAETPATGSDTPAQPAAGQDLPDIDPMTFQWSMAVAETHPAVPLMKECFEKIKEDTNGKITIELYPASSLGTENEVTEMVRAGTILGATLGQQMFESYYPAIAAENLPFIFANPKECYTYFNEYSKENVWNSKVAEATGMYFIGGVIYGMRHLTTSGKEVKAPEDVADLMIRSMESKASMCQVSSLGGTPMPVAYSELYLALQTGTVDGQENPVANILEKKFYEVQKYLVLTSHAINIVVQAANQGIWDSIPEEYRNIVQKTFDEYDQKIIETMEGSEESGIQELEKKGMTVIRQDKLDIDAFRAKAEAAIQEYFGDNKELLEYKEVVQKWLADNR